MWATSVARLLDTEAEQVLIERLLPLATLLTPNLPEAAVLSGLPADSDPRRLGEALLAKGCRAVLVKGGHASGPEVEDWLLTEDEAECLRHPRNPGRVPGPGGTRTAPSTAELAHGPDLSTAVHNAVPSLPTMITGHWLARLGKLGMLPCSQRRLAP